MAIKLVIAGCGGRMGGTIARCALKDTAFTIGSALEVVGHEAIGRDLGLVLEQPADLGVKVISDARLALHHGDVLIEFTTPDATVTHAQIARELRKPMVIGTTGLTDAQLGTLRLAAETIAVVRSPNMSLGVNVLFELVRLAAQRLGPGYDVAVLESHHRQKRDAPSGTAKRLMEAAASARGQLPGAIPVQAVRAGDIVGDHTVLFAGPAERLELTHRAHAREVFALGALRAAQFVVRQPPGLYDMSHVLGASAA
jgi:4-hydroxy-tetrahydrodipicolinate reductase